MHLWAGHRERGDEMGLSYTYDWERRYKLVTRCTNVGTGLPIWIHFSCVKSIEQRDGFTIVNCSSGQGGYAHHVKENADDLAREIWANQFIEEEQIAKREAAEKSVDVGPKD